MNKRLFLLITIFTFVFCSFADSISFDSIVKKYDLKKNRSITSKHDDRAISEDERPESDRVIRFEFGNKGKKEDDIKKQGIGVLFDILSSAHGNESVENNKRKVKDYSNLFSYRNGDLKISGRLGRIKDVKQKRDKLLFIMSSGYIVLFSWSDYHTEFIYYFDDLMFNERVIDFEMLGSRLMYLVFSRWSRIRVMIFDTFYGETILNRVY